jgi:hypothetical protein
MSFREGDSASVRFRHVLFRRASRGAPLRVRRVALLLALGLALPLASAAGAHGSAPTNASSVALSTSAAGAKRVAMAISLHTELQCGRLLGTAVIVTFPRQVRVPGAISASNVLVGTRAARSVAVAGHAVTIAMPLPRGVICDSIGPGVAKIVFSPAAGLGNPRAPGTYTVRLRRGAETFAAALEIR